MDTSRVNPSAAGDDTAWGPQLGHSFDFTLRFEQTVFTLIPSCAFILCSPYYIWKVYRGARLARSGYLFWLKLVCWAATTFSLPKPLSVLLKPALVIDIWLSDFRIRSCFCCSLGHVG